MFSLARTVLNTSKRLYPFYTNIAANFHILVSQRIDNTSKFAFLASKIPSFIPSCGFKVKGRLHLRCKDCFFVRREQRLYVLCKTHGRHKQMAMVKRPENTWILTHATQSKKRAW